MDCTYKPPDVMGEGGGSPIFSPTQKTNSGTWQERKENAEFSAERKKGECATGFYNYIKKNFVTR